MTKIFRCECRRLLCNKFFIGLLAVLLFYAGQVFCLTVYTTYRIAKELYGEDYAVENYVDQWRAAVDDYYLNFYVRCPEYLDALPEAERLAISNALSGMRQYSEMPLKILKAQELVGGEEAMDEILKGLFTRELDPMYPYLTYQDFLDACGLTEEDLSLD